MLKTINHIVNEEAFEGAAMMYGDFNEFLIWNIILATYGLEPIR